MDSFCCAIVFLPNFKIKNIASLTREEELSHSISTCDHSSDHDQHVCLFHEMVF